jgi:predicted dehydrogenase
VDRLTFGVIGCGRMGSRRAATVAAEPSASLIAVADVVEEKARQLATEHGCRPFGAPEELLSMEEIDTVFICTPNLYHAPLAIEAMRNGKHVICEKPLARTPQEAERMVHEAQRRGLTLKVGANLRYFPSILRAREAATSGELGRLLFVRAFIGNDGWPRNGWYADAKLAGGGCVLDNGCHAFDLIRWFLGEPDSCTGQVMNLRWKLEVEDNGIAIFTTAGGQLASVHSSWTEWNGYLLAEIYGAEGMVQVRNGTDTAETTVILRSGGRRHFDFSAEAPDSYNRELGAYLLARGNGDQPRPDGVDGLRAVEMASAVYASARLGKRVGVGT